MYTKIKHTMGLTDINIWDKFDCSRNKANKKLFVFSLEAGPFVETQFLSFCRWNILLLYLYCSLNNVPVLEKFSKEQ